MVLNEVNEVNEANEANEANEVPKNLRYEWEDKIPHVDSSDILRHIRSPINKKVTFNENIVLNMENQVVDAINGLKYALWMVALSNVVLVLLL